MYCTLLRPLASILVALALHPCTAQDWPVGTPVELHMTSISLYGGCYPGIDQVLNIPHSMVTGVEYIAVVTSAYPGGMISITPGISSIVDGDTLHIASTEAREVTFPVGGGQLFLEFYAIGTPTVTGQAHPCVYNELWISDLGICPEGLYFSPQMNCVVQSSISVQGAEPADAHFILPNSGNGQHLSLTGVTGEGDLLLTDACGRAVLQAGLGELMKGIDLSALPSGLYTITIRSRDTAPRSTRFLVNAN